MVDGKKNVRMLRAGAVVRRVLNALYAKNCSNGTREVLACTSQHLCERHEKTQVFPGEERAKSDGTYIIRRDFARRSAYRPVSSSLKQKS